MSRFILMSGLLVWCGCSAGSVSTADDAADSGDVGGGDSVGGDETTTDVDEADADPAPADGDPEPADSDPAPGDSDPAPADADEDIGDPSAGDASDTDLGDADVDVTPPPMLNIDSATLAEGDTGAAELLFTVRIDRAPDSGADVTVQWETADVTATATSDYVSAGATLTFTAGGPLTQQVSVVVSGDTDLEPSETLSVSLTNAVGADLGVAVATGTITADDFPALTLSDATVTEGSGASATLVFTVTLADEPPVGLPVSVEWVTVEGAAIAPDDYAADSGTLTFANGEALVKTIAVTIAGDIDQELDEDLTIELSGAVNVVLTNDTAIGVIESDDFPALTVADASISEGDAGTTALVFTLMLDVAPLAGQAASVSHVTASGSASSTVDFTLTSGTTTFTSTDALQKTVSVPVLGDSTIELTETFTLDLPSAVNLELPASDPLGSIGADDFPVISVDDPSVLEGDTGTAALVFTVSVSPEPLAGQVAQVSYSFTGSSATSGVDFTATGGSLSFVNGAPLSQTITVDVSGDTSIEPNETLTLQLTIPVQAEIPDATGVGTISADDFPSVSIANVTRAEGSSGNATVNVTVTISDAPPPGLNLTVEWDTADGSATAASDYLTGGNTLTFTSTGPLSQDVISTVVGDTTPEADESYSIVLSNVQRGTIADDTGVVTLTNDDYIGTSVNDVSVLEGTGAGTTTLSFTVTIEAAPSAGNDAVVNWATSNGSAVEGQDYTSANGTLTFTSTGPLTQTVSVTITRDSTVEPDETLTVTLSGPQNTTITDATGVGTITADDFPNVTLADATGAEGNSGTSSLSFSVTLSASPPAGYPLSFTATPAAGTATAGVDFNASPVTVSIAPGSSVNQTFSVPLYGDTLEEPDETFTVTASNATNVGTLSPTTVTGTITSDDPPHAIITYVEVEEGDAGDTQVTFTVSLSSSPLSGGRNAVVGWSTVDGTARAPADYAAASGTLTFVAGGSLTQTVSTTVRGDTLAERNEIFSVALTATSNVILDQAVGVAKIRDDEGAILTIDDVTLTEGNSGTKAFIFTVTSSQFAAPGNDITVSWRTLARNAAGVDFVAGSGVLTFTSSGADTATITVNVNGDTTVEPFEEFAVFLSGAVNARIGDEQGLGTIVDDDGAIIRVDPTASGTTDGTTWLSAYRTVQEGINRVQTLGGGQVWVASARYASTSAAALVTLRSNVTVLGGFEGYAGGSGAQETAFDQREAATNVTVLDGANFASSVVTGSAASFLDGFTITRGNTGGNGGGMVTSSGSVVANCVFIGNRAVGYGGALYNSGNPWIHDCRLIGNSADEGGGTYDSSSSPTIEDTIYASNSVADYGGGARVHLGRGSYNRNLYIANTAVYGAGGQSVWSIMTMRGNDFVNNRATSSSGGWYANWGDDRMTDCTFMHNQADSGGGLHVRDSGYSGNQTALPADQRGFRGVNLRIEHNQASSSGGGVYTWGGFGLSPAQFIRSVIVNNRASTNGGGAYNLSNVSHYIDTVIEGNTAGSRGGGVMNSGSSSLFTSCTLAGNVAAQGPEMYVSSSGVPLITNSIVFNRTQFTPAVLVDAGCAACSVTYTTSTRSDLGENPLFVRVPVRSHRGSAATSTVTVTSASTYFTVGDVIELADDGVARTVTAVAATSLTVSPGVTTALASGARIDNWGPGATNLLVDLRLASGSPSIDAGTNASVYADTTDLDGDANITEPLPYDCAGLPRFVDDAAVTDTGSGTAPIVDIGAHERQ